MHLVSKQTYSINHMKQMFRSERKFRRLTTTTVNARIFSLIGSVHVGVCGNFTCAVAIVVRCS